MVAERKVMNLGVFNQKPVQTKIWKSAAFCFLVWLYEEQNGVKAPISGEQNEKGLRVELLKSGDLCDFPLPFHRFWVCVQAFFNIH